MNKEAILNKLKNLTVYQAMYVFIIAFILFQILNTVYKNVERDKYDLEKIISKIEERSVISPHNKLYFHNVYIRNGKLKKIRRYYILPVGVCIIYFMFSFAVSEYVDIQFLKLRQIKKAVKKIGSVGAFMMSLVIMVIVFLMLVEIRRNVWMSDVTKECLNVNTLEEYRK